jgi:hypothetical protein
MSMEALRWARSVRGVEPSDKLVLLLLSDQANDDGLCWPSVAGIAADGCMSERTAQRALAALDAAGLVIRTGNGGRNMTRRYTLQFHVNAPVERVTSTTLKGDVVTPIEAKRVTSTTLKGDTVSLKGDIYDVKGCHGDTRTLKNPHRTLNEPSTRVRASVAGFADFWLAYPRKVGKGAAERAFNAAVAKGASVADIAAGLNRQRWPADRQFIPHPTTWLNQTRWQDDPAAAAPPPKPPAGKLDWLLKDMPADREADATSEFPDFTPLRLVK